jgi:glycosyltransferase involved in cell wall biosynthesis
MKVAIVCDWLTGIGGAERVVLELHKMYPKAPIYTSQYSPGSIDGFEEATIKTTWLQTLPAGLKKFLPVLRAWTFSHLDLSGYDLVISSTGAEAKAIKTGEKTTHISYMHSPTHYYWIRHDEYLSQPGFPRGFNWLAKLSLKLLIGPLKRWDRRVSRRPDFIIANSNYTKDNIKRYYKREAEVIFPPVNVDGFKLARTSDASYRHGFVIAGRQVPYKRFDLAIVACNELKVPLIVIGDGPDHRRLEKLAGRQTTFLTNVSDGDMADHFRSSLGFIMPNADDFGIVAVEAMAAGTPVIAYQKGGSLDYLLPGKTGLFFDRQTPASLRSCLETALTKSFDYEAISEHAKQFSCEAFRKNMRQFIDECLKEKANA